MGNFLSIFVGIAEQWIAQNAGTIEHEVMAAIEKGVASLLNTITHVKTNGTAPPTLPLIPLVPPKQ